MPYEKKSGTHPAVFMVIAVTLIAGAITILQTNQAAYDFFFKQDPQQAQLNIPLSQLTKITDSIRDNKRDEWLEKVRTLYQHVELIQAKRSAFFDRVLDAKGPDYLSELQRLSTAQHAPVQSLDLSQDDVPLHDIYQAARFAELTLVNYYRDISSAQYGMQSHVAATDAVGWVKVVVPQRVDLDAYGLDQSVADYGHLESFKTQLLVGGSSFEAMNKNMETIIEKIGADEGEGSEGFQVEAMMAVAGSFAGETLNPDELELGGEAASDDFGAMPGRVLSRNAILNNNFYLDKWYVMGPFENRGRANLDASFLPESIIDLDNTTIGKDGKEIGWEYWVRSHIPNKPRIEPRFAKRGSIYYGWTEVFAEEAGPYWIAVGSDDYGKMWVNGELIWKSGTRPKPYRPSEYVLEVELKQGVNEILFRCENGGGTMGWSVIFLAAMDEEA
jgi:hypothetical protein